MKSDVQSEASTQFEYLDWVGMSQLQSMIQVDLGNANGFCFTPASIDVGVDLVENQRGIHMSRLYQLVHSQLLNQSITYSRLSIFAEACLQSQKGLSKSFSCRIRFDLPRLTLALKSETGGFRTYPVELIFEKDRIKGEAMWMQLEVLYSSTCPQSASLSMEKLRQSLQKTTDDSSVDLSSSISMFPATPHAQRSRALVRIKFSGIENDGESQNISLEKVLLILIEATEAALGTPVQTAVKRADEMRFAELNAENLMFCEDAARKISMQLQNSQKILFQKFILGYRVFCEHQESLHSHNASCIKQWEYNAPQFFSF